jgi:hypothetical protein
MGSEMSAATKRPWMPSQRHVLLVRAALLAGEPAIDAWNRWKLTGDLDRIDDGSSALLPLVYRNLSDQGVDDPMVRRARDAYKMTWLENEQRFAELSTLLESASAAGIETMVLKGVALALLYYRDLGLRSMGDVDILIRPDDVADAIDRLTELGWRKAGRTPTVLTETYLNARREIHFVSDRTTYLDLHWRVMDETCLSSRDDGFWSGAIRTSVRGAETHAMNPTDQLLHVCAHATLWTPAPFPRWIADAATILKTSRGDIDWDRLLSHAPRLGLVIPVREALKQVVDVLDAPIPSSVLDSLHRLPLSKEDLRNYRIRCLPPNPLRTLTLEFRRMSLQSGRADRRWRLLAFPSYVRALWGLEHAWQLPVKALLWGAHALGRLPGYYGKRLIGRTVRRP